MHHHAKERRRSAHGERVLLGLKHRPYAFRPRFFFSFLTDLLFFARPIYMLWEALSFNSVLFYTRIHQAPLVFVWNPPPFSNRPDCQFSFFRCSTWFIFLAHLFLWLSANAQATARSGGRTRPCTALSLCLPCTFDRLAETHACLSSSAAANRFAVAMLS